MPPVNGRAAGGVGDDAAVAKQLGQQAHVGGFAAASAGAGELEQRLQELRFLDRGRLESIAVGVGQVEEEGEVLAFLVAQRKLGRHVDGLAIGVGLVFGGAGFYAHAAAGAVFGGNPEQFHM